MDGDEGPWTVGHVLARAKLEVSTAKEVTDVVCSLSAVAAALLPLEGSSSGSRSVGELAASFLDGAYLPFAAYLLREVSPRWLSQLAPEERAACLDPFFAPPVIAPLALLALCDGLLPRTDTTEGAATRHGAAAAAAAAAGAAGAPQDAFTAQYICGLLERKFLLQGSLTPLGSPTFWQGVSSRYYAANRTEPLAASLALVPQRAANALGPLTSRSLSPARFYAQLCSLALTGALGCQSCSSRCADGSIRGEGPPAMTFWAAWAAKAADMGHGRTLAAVWVAELQNLVSGGDGGGGGGSGGGGSSCKDSERVAATHSAVFAAMPPGAQEAVAFALLSAAEAEEPAGAGSEANAGSSSADAESSGAGRVCRLLVGRSLLAAQGNLRGDAGGGSSGGGSGGGGSSLLYILTHKLLMARTLPPAGAVRLARLLLWCEGNGSKGTANAGGENELVLPAVCRVAAVWGDSEAIMASSAKRQESNTAFLETALDGLQDRQLSLGGEAVALLVRGVGSHLDCTTRAARLRGMRVGRSLARKIGQPLVFEELEDAERQAAAVAAARAAAAAGTSAAAEKTAAEAGRRTGNGRGNGKGNGRASVDSAAQQPPGGDGNRVSKEISSAGGSNGGARAGTPGKRRARGGKRRAPAAPADIDPDMVLAVDGSDSEDGSSGGSGGETDLAEDLSNEWSDADAAGSGGGGGNSEGGGSDAESEEDYLPLEPYPLADDRADLAAVPQPEYLRSVLELLASREENDTFDKHEAALKAIPGLVARRPHDLAHVAAALVRRLLFLEDAFDMPGFDGMRSEALTAVCAACPEVAAPCLCNEIFGGDTALGNKLDSLRALAAAAWKLSGRGAYSANAGSGAGKNPAGRNPLLQLQLGGSGGAEQLPHGRRQGRRQVMARIAMAEAAAAGSGSGNADGGAGAAEGDDGGDGGKGAAAPAVAAVATTTNSGALMPQPAASIKGANEPRTRRWGYRRGSAPRTAPNRFSAMAAACFFYPCLRGMTASTEDPTLWGGGGGGGIDGGGIGSGSGALLLARVLVTLACFVDCAGRGATVPTMAADLATLAWSFRASADPGVQRALMAALDAALTGLGDTAAARRWDGGPAIAAWLQVAAAAAPDDAARQAAAAVLAAHAPLLLALPSAAAEMPGAWPAILMKS